MPGRCVPSAKLPPSWVHGFPNLPQGGGRSGRAGAPVRAPHRAPTSPRAPTDTSLADHPPFNSTDRLHHVHVPSLIGGPGDGDAKRPAAATAQPSIAPTPLAIT